MGVFSILSYTYFKNKASFVFAVGECAVELLLARLANENIDGNEDEDDSCSHRTSVSQMVERHGHLTAAVVNTAVEIAACSVFAVNLRLRGSRTHLLPTIRRRIGATSRVACKYLACKAKSVACRAAQTRFGAAVECTLSRLASPYLLVLESGHEDFCGLLRDDYVPVALDRVYDLFVEMFDAFAGVTYTVVDSIKHRSRYSVFVWAIYAPTSTFFALALCSTSISLAFISAYTFDLNSLPETDTMSWTSIGISALSRSIQEHSTPIHKSASLKSIDEHFFSNAGQHTLELRSPILPTIIISAASPEINENDANGESCHCDGIEHHPPKKTPSTPINTSFSHKALSPNALSPNTSIASTSIATKRRRPTLPQIRVVSANESFKARIRIKRQVPSPVNSRPLSEEILDALGCKSLSLCEMYTTMDDVIAAHPKSLAQIDSADSIAGMYKDKAGPSKTVQADTWEPAQWSPEHGEWAFERTFDLSEAPSTPQRSSIARAANSGVTAAPVKVRPKCAPQQTPRELRRKHEAPVADMTVFMTPEGSSRIGTESAPSHITVFSR